MDRKSRHFPRSIAIPRKDAATDDSNVFRKRIATILLRTSVRALSREQVNRVNPKTYILFAAVVPRFINTSQGITAWQIVARGQIPMLIGLIANSV